MTAGSAGGRSNGSAANPRMTQGLGATVAGINQNFGLGAIEQTGRSLDIAIDGDGFFATRNTESNQVLFTRNGNFGRDDTGRLVTKEGFAVLDDGGSEIVFAPDETNITIGRDGTVSTDLGTIERHNAFAADPIQSRGGWAMCVLAAAVAFPARRGFAVHSPTSTVPSNTRSSGVPVGKRAPCKS